MSERATPLHALPQAEAPAPAPPPPLSVPLTDAEQIAFEALRDAESALAEKFARCGRSVLQRAGAPDGATYASRKDARGVIVEFVLLPPSRPPQPRRAPMGDDELRRLAEFLPAYPRGLTPIEWCAVAAVAALLIGYVWSEVRIRPRAARLAEVYRARERSSFLRALATSQATFERSVLRLHERLDARDAAEDRRHAAMLVKVDTLQASVQGAPVVRLVTHLRGPDGLATIAPDPEPCADLGEGAQVRGRTDDAAA